LLLFLLLLHKDIFPLPGAFAHPTDHSVPIPAPGPTLGFATWVLQKLQRSQLCKQPSLCLFW